MKQGTRFERWMGSAVLMMPIWCSVAALYFIAEALTVSLAPVGLWIFATAGVCTVALWFFLRPKWLTVWLVLKASVVRLLIIGCQLLVFFVTRSIIGCLVVTFLFAHYAKLRCDALQLGEAERVQETEAILRDCNLGLIAASFPFLYQTLFLTSTVAAIGYQTGLSQTISIVALLLLHVTAVFGLVQFQSVICRVWLNRNRK